MVTMMIFIAPNIVSAQAAPQSSSVGEMSQLSLSTGGSLYILAYIGSKFVTWGANMVNWTINLNNKVLDNPAVKIGWPVTRDIANLGFVLAIIVIAFATILQFQSYHMQKTLFRLVWVALLINFSLVIAALFIDFSTILTHFFISKTTDPDKLSLILANALQVQKLLLNTQPPDKLTTLTGIITGNFTGALEFVSNLFFVLFFTAMSAITMFGLAFMMYIRYLWLVILLTLAPLAWLAHAWPDLDQYWGKWWSQFFKYVWFAPAMSFFIYLAIAVLEKSSDYSVGATLSAQIFSFDSTGETVAKMLTVIGILFGGMFSANAAGIYGAGATVGAFNTFTGYVTGTGKWAGRKTAGLGTGLLDRASVGLTGKTIRENLRSSDTLKGLSRIPLVGGAFDAVDRGLAAGGQKTMAAFDADHSSLTKEGRINKFMRGIIDPEERASLMATMAKNNELRDLEKEFDKKPESRNMNRQKYDDYLGETIKRGGPAEKLILARNPLLARLKVAVGENDPFYSSALKEAFANVRLTNEAAANINLEELRTRYQDFLEKFTSGSISSFAQADGRTVDDMNKMAELYEQQIRSKIDEINKEGISEDRKKELRESLARLSTTAGFINRSPAWGGRQVDPDLLEKINPKEGGTPKKNRDADGMDVPPPPKPIDGK